MSIARSQFLANLAGIGQAINLEPLAQGAMGTSLPPGIFVLRRGVLVASLIALETFVRERTVEVLRNLERWPKSFEDLPEKLRLAARLDALSYLHNFARMLKRQGDDFEAEVQAEITKMASGHGTVQQFTKFVAGDYTGNLSDSGLKDLLASLQVSDCWTTFRAFSAEIGLGVPSVQEVVKGIVRKRHRSAHSATYAPTATEVSSLQDDLLCIALCFDVSISASLEQAIAMADDWALGRCSWRAGVILYIAKPYDRRMRLYKYGQSRALRIANQVGDFRALIPRPPAGQIAVLVEQNASARPHTWQIL
ncbi:hypothetical protein [Novosphingobium sp. 9U]|uniref:hypothetical protein n=1 Tax=Novosphingobium sp. 9U TaxID=2653158 RepID=UPI0013592D14|nr:hypothetical protein [Novosphingobium sp. 9U]